MADDAGPSYGGDEEPSTSTAVSAAWTPADNPSGIKPILQNIVATCNLATELDLKTIALKARNAEYNPKRFAAVIMRIRDPKTTALIFRSGKMVVTGDTSQTDLEKPNDSGLLDALHRLRHTRGVAMAALAGVDIVRHNLVQRIVDAYGEQKS